jgi:hypothetical protein
MALGRQNVSVARTNGSTDIFRLAGLLGDENLIRHELLAWRIGPSRERPAPIGFQNLAPFAEKCKPIRPAVAAIATPAMRKYRVRQGNRKPVAHSRSLRRNHCRDISGFPGSPLFDQAKKNRPSCATPHATQSNPARASPSRDRRTARSARDRVRPYLPHSVTYEEACAG